VTARVAAPAFRYGPAARTPAAAAAFVRRAGFALLMPHRGVPLPSLWEAIRGRPGGHPFHTWTGDSDRMWEWKDLLSQKRLAVYGAIWLGRPGFCAPALLPCLLKLWGTPPGLDGFRAAYREGRLTFDAHRLAEALLHRGASSTYRLRKHTGVAPATFARAVKELEKTLIVTRCGTDERDTTWAAGVVDLTARVFPQRDGEARRLSYAEARETALATLEAVAPGMPPRLAARLLRTGIG
jgi:DNA-binding MarR family transcriptional regulator